MKTVSLVAAASLLVGGASGYFIGSSSAPESEVDEVAKTQSPRSSKPRNEPVRLGSRETRLVEVLSRPGQTDRLQGLLDLYDQMSLEDFEAEAERLSELPGAERFIGAFLLYSKWGAEDPIAAMNYSGKLGWMGMMVKPIVLQGWAGTDPRGAVDYYEKNKGMFAMMGRMGGGGPTGAIAGEWARQDPQGALEWSQSLEGREQNSARSSIFRNLAITDPSRAASLAASLDGLDERNDANSEIARSWGSTDWEASQEWINSLPLDEQAQAKQEAIRGLAQSDPMKAAEEALGLPAGEERDRTITEVAESMAMKNPAEAADWIMKNGSEDAQAEAIDDVMRSWATTDQSAAKAFLDNQPQGEVRDKATSSYVLSSQESPEVKIELASTISDEDQRTWTVARSASQWMQSEPEAAKAWVEQTHLLDDRTKERIQNGNNRGWGGFGRGRR